MRARTAIERWNESLNLPLGHIERTAAREAVNAIYKDSREQERKWNKRRKRKFTRLDQKQAVRFVREMCEALGEDRPPALVWESTELLRGTAGHCNFSKRELHFWSCNYFSTSSLIHELTHYIGKVCGHGDDFCDLELLLFEVADVILKKWKEEEMCPWKKGENQ